jgi:DNA-binding MurR/RpiR family transcriptional regulator
MPEPVPEQVGEAGDRPASFDALQTSIADQYDEFSRRLQQVAEYALTHPDDIALETIAVIADRAGVPPSSLIRFAKALGFDGFTEMQRLFRERLIERVPTYSERIRRLRNRHRQLDGSIPALVLDDFAAASIAALERLRRELPIERLEQAADLLAGADTIYITAQRRAFPAAAYLAYLLGELSLRAYLLDSVGGMLAQQARSLRQGDALIAISFRSYAPEVLSLAESCHARDIAIVALTDGPLSPLGRLAKVSLEVVETDIQAFRSVSATMCLALTLAVSIGERAELNGRRAPLLPVAGGQG